MRALPVLAAVLISCVGGVTDLADAGVAPPLDAGVDAGTRDAGPVHDAGSFIDAGIADAGPSHYAGTYANVLLDFPIVVRNVREHAVAYDVFNGGGYVITFVDASGASGPGFRLQALNLRVNPDPVVGQELALDDAIPTEHYSAECALTAGPGGTFLAAFKGYRQVPAGAAHQNHIYGQLIRASADGGLERVGSNFVISAGSTNEQMPCTGWDEQSQTYFVAWSSPREVMLREDGLVVFGRSVSVTGALGPELRLGENESGQRRCSVRGGRGSFFVGWDDYLPTGGPNFNTAYRARVVAGGVVGPVLPVTRVGMVIPDPVGLAYNARNEEWLMATALNRTIRVSIYTPDGGTRVVDRVVASPPEGAGVPHAAWSPVTNSYLVTWHAWTSNDAAAVEVDPDGRPVGPLLQLNTVAPPNGTYLTPAAASTRSGEFLVVMMKDFSRLRGTLFRSTESLAR